AFVIAASFSAIKNDPPAKTVAPPAIAVPRNLRRVMGRDFLRRVSAVIKSSLGLPKLLSTHRPPFAARGPEM
ncbi:MAG: hypothetical protein ACREP1_02825, partial [Rhodanobacteraceae bacterium]